LKETLAYVLTFKDIIEKILKDENQTSGEEPDQHCLHMKYSRFMRVETSSIILKCDNKTTKTSEEIVREL
jgi:hypothetical protein